MAVPTLTPNSPVAGSIAWSAFTIRYAGVSYAVGASSTALKYTYWLYNSGSPILSAADLLPVLGDDDLLLFINKAGVPLNVPASSVVDGSIVVDGTIVGAALIAGTVHGDRIQGHTITALQIAADTITANEIAAGAITASELNVEVLRAGFTLTGKVQVGTSYWTPQEGLVIPQPNGGRIQLPADGVTPARFDGHINAKSLTVEKDLNIMGATNKVSGQVTLASGITEPTVAPSMYQSWPSVTSSALDASTVSWRMFHGMSAHHSNAALFATAVDYGGAGIRFIDRTTGGWGGDLAGISGWNSNFAIRGGIGYLASHYYVYGQDYNRAGGHYIYKIVAATGAKAAEVLVGPDTAHASGMPAITCDAATGNVYLFWTEGTLGRQAIWDANLGNLLVATTFHDFGVQTDMESAWRGTADYGSARVILGLNSGGRSFASFTVPTFSTLTYTGTESFPYPEAGLLRGIYYDATLARFKSYDKAGRIFTHSNWKTAQAFTGSYTWYDGAGTVRETREGPFTSFTLSPRSHLNLETSVPPDSGNTDAAQVDKANRAGVYVGIGAGARARQIYLDVDGSGISIRRHTMDTVASGSNPPPAANGFVGGTTSTGKIVSGATSAGQPILELAGDGNGKMGSLALSGVLTSTSVGPASTAIGPFAVNWTSAAKFWKYGLVVTIYIDFTTTVARGAGSAAGVVPVGSRPPVAQYIQCVNNASGANVPIYVGADGGIYCQQAVASGVRFVGQVTYIIGT